MNSSFCLDGIRGERAGLLLRAAVAGLAALIVSLTSHGQTGERSGKDVVDAVCVACHKDGAHGAPKIGDRDAWVPRMKRGIDNLVRSATWGHGGMPPRGGQANLSDPELRSAVLYMFNPGAAGPSTRTRSAAVAEKPAPTSANEKIVGGLKIFVGYMAAESLLAFPADSVERTMHGGVPKGSGYFHLNVSLFDSVNNAPITDAKIEARIQQPGLTGESKPLEPIPLGTASYGNYVKVMRQTPYQVILQIRTANSPSPVEARFEHRF